MSKVDLEFVSIEYREPIVYLRFKENVTLYGKEVKAIGEACKKVTNGNKYLALTDIETPLDITPEGRKASAEGKNGKNIIANAILVRRLGQRLIANVYEEVNKPPFPIKVFTEEAEAEKWLLMHQEEYNLLAKSVNESY